MLFNGFSTLVKGLNKVVLVTNSVFFSALLKLSKELIETTRSALLGTKSSIERCALSMLLQLEISRKATKKYKILRIDECPLFEIKQR
jgi:hypothetical protein|tara:strand:- start:287 stop:550 length:264 start_codon:yes stop_codon:yes gene_type:complete